MNDPAVKFGNDEQQKQPASPQNAIRLEDIWGTIRRVSAAPTWTPRGRLIDYFAYYSSGGTKRFYVYDESGKTWSYVALT